MEAAPRERLRKVGITTGYVAFFFGALLVAMVLTFPTRQLKTFIEGEARKAGYRLRIEAMSLRGLGSATFEGVDLTMPPGKSKDGEEPAAPLSVHLDVLRLDVALWRALTKREFDVGFELEAGAGVLEGGRAVLRPLGGGAADDDKPADPKARGRAAAPKPRRGYAIDLTIEAMDHLPLRKMGLDRAAFAFQDKLRGDLDGLLSGSVTLHYGGTVEELDGAIDLTISDATLRQPSVELPKMGRLELTDLRMGTLTAKVTIDKKAKIAILKAARGSDKSTAVALEGVDIFGRDIELVVEERSHVLIPPGPAGSKLATLQVHFAFALPEAKDEGDKAGRKAKGDKADGDKTDGDKTDGEEVAKAEEDAPSDRAKWSSIMQLAGDKLEPFVRNGYVGMTCSGALARPNCAPSLPQVTVGTRRKARSAAAENADKKDNAKPEDKAPEGRAAGSTDQPPQDAGAVAPEPTPAAAPVPGRPENIEMKPAVRGVPTLPRPAPPLGGPAVEQNNAPRFEPEGGRARPPRPARPGRPTPADEEGDEGGGGDEAEEGAPERGGDEAERPEPEAEEGAEGEGEGEERPNKAAAEESEEGGEGAGEGE
jgi:hypothetical protein